MSRERASRERVSLLARNLPLSMSAQDVKDKFAKYGPLRDVYLPQDHYTRRPRGFGFIEFAYERDAEDAMNALDGKIWGGREITVVPSKKERKTPLQMKRMDDRNGRAPSTRSRSRSPGRRRRGSRSRSRSRTPRRRRRRSRSASRSPEPRERSRSRAGRRERSPDRRERSPDRKRQRGSDRSADRSRERSPRRRERSPGRERRRRGDRSPDRERDRRPDRSADRSRGRSPRRRDRSPERERRRSLDQSSERNGRGARRSADRIPGRSPDLSPDRSPGRQADRSPVRRGDAADRAEERLRAGERSPSLSPARNGQSDRDEYLALDDAAAGAATGGQEPPGRGEVEAREDSGADSPPRGRTTLSPDSG